MRWREIYIQLAACEMSSKKRLTLPAHLHVHTSGGLISLLAFSFFFFFPVFYFLFLRAFEIEIGG